MQLDVSNGERQAAGPTVVSTLTGVRGYAVGGVSGCVIDARGLENEREHVVGVSVEITQRLGNAASLLGIGALRVATLRAESRRWVLGFRDDHSIVVDVESNTRLSVVEFAVGLDDWVPKPEPGSAVTRAAPGAAEDLGNATAPGDETGASAQTATAHEEPAPRLPQPRSLSPMPQPSAPPLPQGSVPPLSHRGTTGAKLSTSLAPPSLSSSNARGLRRALADGDLSSVREIAGHLRRAYAPRDDLCGSGSSAQAIAPLMAGIACVLAGNGRAALTHLRAAREVPEVGLSLNWAAYYWSARAAAIMPRGGDAALTNAKMAAQISTRLDVEARAQSARLLVALFVERRDPTKAKQFLDHYRRFLETTGNVDDLAEASMLEARISLLAGADDEARVAAEQAYASRPGWSAPITIMCRCALAASNVQRASELTAPLVTEGSQEPELLRLARLLEAVQCGHVTPWIAAELLWLNDAPPEPDNLARLAQLAQYYVGLDIFHEVLGWKLLRHGDLDAAKSAFACLEEIGPLPDDTRVSLFLGLGCLAALSVNHPNSCARLRSIVDSVPAARRSPHSSVGVGNDDVSLLPAEIPLSGTLPSPLAVHSVAKGFTGPATNCIGTPSLLGALQAFGLEELLEFLNAGRSTGVVICSSVRGVGAIDLREGAITGAIAPCTLRLSDVLLAQGKTNARDIELAVATQASKQAALPVGTILVQAGCLAREELEAALRAQAENAVAEVLSWGGGLFAFCPELAAPAPTATVEIAVDPSDMFASVPEEPNV